MQKKGANISLKGYDDIFSTDQSRAEAQQERVQEIPLSELHPFEGHPFRVVDDEEMMKTAESVRDFGVLTPAIVRPDPDGGYEIVSGHRRHRASELAGKETMPAIVRDLDDDAAIILMVDANLQRESILPSERAYVEDMSGDEKVRTIQSKELWLAEDMTFYVVSCMSTITMDKEEAICLNEHRSVVTTVECEDDIFFDMGSLICELDDICLFELLADVDATIYEL